MHPGTPTPERIEPIVHSNRLSPVVRKATLNTEHKGFWSGHGVGVLGRTGERGAEEEANPDHNVFAVAAFAFMNE
jgi:hypothetical protein